MAIETRDNPFIVMTSHGSHDFLPYQQVADELFDGKGAGIPSDFLQYQPHAEDASDHAVGSIGEYIDRTVEAAVVIGSSLGGRMFINPNGAREKTQGVMLLKTFGGAPVWKVPPSAEVQEAMTKRVWDTFHARAQGHIEDTLLATTVDKHTLIVDVHDTDALVFDREGRLKVQEPVAGYFGFPLLVVSDKEGKAAHPEVTQLLGNNLLYNLVELGLIDAERAEQDGVTINDPYKGGFTTQRYGVDLPNAYLLGDYHMADKAQHTHMVQVELNRSMYLKKDRSGLDKDRLEDAQLAVAEALRSTANEIQDWELGDWRAEPVKGSEAWDQAQSLPLVADNPWY